MITCDARDADIVNAHRWYVGQGGYVVHGEKSPDGRQHYPRLHRLIAARKLQEEGLTLLPEQVVLFRDGDKTNCTRANLIIAGQSTVRHNRMKQADATSAFVGVNKTADGSYRARISKDHRRRSIGVFATELEAAIAYDDVSELQEWYGNRRNGTQGRQLVS